MDREPHERKGPFTGGLHGDTGGNGRAKLLVRGLEEMRTTEKWKL